MGMDQMLYVVTIVVNYVFREVSPVPKNQNIGVKETNCPLHTNDLNVKNIKNVQNIRTVLASDSIKASLPERVKQTKGKVINT